jgi:hypothetical protein
MQTIRYPHNRLKGLSRALLVTALTSFVRHGRVGAKQSGRRHDHER